MSCLMRQKQLFGRVLWEIQLGVISVAEKQSVMDYAAQWEDEEEDELVIEKAELER